MIVEPDFLEHWKTQMLSQTLEDPCAPLYLIRLWAHCQNRKTDALGKGSRLVVARMIAAIVRFPITGEKSAEQLFQALIDCSFIDLSSESDDAEKITVIAHDWAQANAKLVANWSNGLKGGRPRKTETQPKPKPAKRKPTDNPTQDRDNPPTTQPQVRLTDREEKIEKIEKIGEEVEVYPRLLLVLENDLTIENAISALRAGHPDFEKVPDMNLQNSFRGQLDRKKWPAAIEGLVARYAGADLERPNQTLINWLGGKPSEKNAAADPVGKRLKLNF